MLESYHGTMNLEYANSIDQAVQRIAARHTYLSKRDAFHRDQNASATSGYPAAGSVHAGYLSVGGLP